MIRTDVRRSHTADGAAVDDPSAFAFPAERPPLGTAEGSVIIPAHNEAQVIARTLRALAPLAASPSVEVIVVCNGCSDDTAQVARTFPWARVEDTPERSKTAALNLGDRIATRWPRLYLDADIEVSPAAVLETFAALTGPGVRAARPTHAYDISSASPLVRGYYRARSRIPGPLRLWGAGSFATNEEGHRRLGAFPAVTADDSWFDAQFSESEKQIVSTTPTRVRTPRTVSDLVNVLSRQRRGYLELHIPAETRSRGTALTASIRGPRTALDAIAYAAITVVSRALADRAIRRAGAHTWERDDSTRVRNEDREAFS
ncbi:glycosyltransferase [Xylanimonas allomyrinae]|uniref:4,4'-diaponeurosporenoate glycosyltransferase n=1 Tax=Xylanimonas allomyrinae TaxID=2509459 RepID=A0A4P6EVA0_9MICO|nr:glycosyltransferase [Xylanimonas allomyrinae]QAY61968.1 glycosyltransferase [Xylanimonas allomyrinae]